MGGWDRGRKWYFSFGGLTLLSCPGIFSERVVTHTKFDWLRLCFFFFIVYLFVCFKGVYYYKVLRKVATKYKIDLIIIWLVWTEPNWHSAPQMVRKLCKCALEWSQWNPECSSGIVVIIRILKKRCGLMQIFSKGNYLLFDP